MEHHAPLALVREHLVFKERASLHRRFDSNLIDDRTILHRVASHQSKHLFYGHALYRAVMPHLTQEILEAINSKARVVVRRRGGKRFCKLCQITFCKRKNKTRFDGINVDVSAKRYVSSAL